MHSPYLPVPVVFIFFPYRNPYPYLRSSNTANRSHCNISSRTIFLFPPVRETVFALNIFPYQFFCFFPYGNSYPYLSFSSTGNGRHCSIPSRTHFCVSASEFVLQIPASRANTCSEMHPLGNPPRHPRPTILMRVVLLWPL